jgi:hypothetical protein
MWSCMMFSILILKIKRDPLTPILWQSKFSQIKNAFAFDLAYIHIDAHECVQFLESLHLA